MYFVDFNKEIAFFMSLPVFWLCNFEEYIQKQKEDFLSM